MKKALLTFVALLAIGSLHAQVAKTKWDLPSAMVKTLDGKSIDTKSFENDGKPIIISFWATWCKPCVLELNTIMDEYEDWQDETGVKLIAISIDDARNTAKVAPFVNGKGWDYDVYLDSNGDFKRVMNVNTVPHTFVLNGDKQVVYSHNAYAPGDEEHLYEIVKENSGK
ncbi:MAG: TlpA disulfide reductase family protein [Flavobacteriales bacterium]|nr:TlpA disulfide reductase family protein [Flavobacteriales bacterium]